MLVTVKQVVLTHREIEEVAGRDAGGVVIVVFCAGRRNAHIFGSVLARRAQAIPRDELIGMVGVANTPPQESPAWNC